MDGQIGLLLDATVETLQHPAPADQVDPVRDEILRELGRRAGEAGDDGVADGAHLLLDRGPHLLGDQHDRLREAGHEIATAHLGLPLVLDRVRGRDGELDLLGRAFTDGHAVLAAYVGLDRRVDVERSDPHRFERDDTTEGDDRHLGRSTADVDDHVAERFMDRQ